MIASIFLSGGEHYFQYAQIMTLAADEFIRRFLIHVLPRGFHRIRHYGLLAGSARKDNLARARCLLAVAPPSDDEPDEAAEVRPPCPCCGGRMILVERFAPGTAPRTILTVRIDTS